MRNEIIFLYDNVLINKLKQDSMKPLTEQQKDYLRQFLHHKLICNIMQDWSEAEQAMADTPERFKDESWHLAYDEMRQKMNTCTCGLSELLALQGEQPRLTDDDKR